MDAWMWFALGWLGATISAGCGVWWAEKYDADGRSLEESGLNPIEWTAVFLFWWAFAFAAWMMKRV